MRCCLLSLLVLMSSAACAAVERGGHGGGHGAAVHARESATPSWTRAPLLLAGARMGRTAVWIEAHNIAAEAITVIAPDTRLNAEQVAVIDGRGRVEPLREDVGAHHLLFAREQADGRIVSAASWWNFPTPGTSPREVLGRVRGGLELMPVDLPDRGPYREGTRHGFVLRMDGAPLAGVRVVLESSQGSRVVLHSDAAGVIDVLLPRDFDPAQVDREGRQARADFVLFARIERDGVEHLSAFNGPYGPDPMRQRDLSGGVAFMLLGMALAVPLLRSRRG